MCPRPQYTDLIYMEGTGSYRPEVPDPVGRYSPFSISTGLWLREAYLQSSNAIAITTDGQTDIAQVS